MRHTTRLILGIVGVVIGHAVVLSTGMTAEEPDLSKPGVVIDFTGPPEDKAYRIDFSFYLVGQKDPVRRSAHGNWKATAVKLQKKSLELQGFVAEIAGPTHVRVIARTVNGRAIPVERIEFASPDLRPDQLPRVVTKPIQ